ncbi:MAG: SpoIID/LytB domain-containing protein [Actinomycetia bacterium]|nr:SpoIID/LytB domain-containing protein [Actinomycetes bacterium]
MSGVTNQRRTLLRASTSALVPILVTVPMFVVAVPSSAVSADGSGSAAGDRTDGWAVAADPPADVRTSRRASVTIRGRGFGHGIGMSQYGAEGAAHKGLGYRRILRYYYPKTKLVERRAFIRVHITADTGNSVVVRDAPKMRVRDGADGKVFRLPAWKRIRRWRIVPTRGKPWRSTVQYLDRRGWHRWKVPGRTWLRGDGTFRSKRRPLRLVLPNGSVSAYRGGIRAAEGPGREIETVNVLRLQHYLKGVVPVEMPSYWSQPALRAQSVAARSYALHLKARGSHDGYDLCDTTSCQVYGGFGVETKATNRAVRATSGTVVAYRGKAALTMFSSSSGGWTASGGLPYLRAHRDRYDRWSGNPMRSWTERISTARFERAYPSLGRLRSVRVTKRNGHGKWNGRAERVVLRGTRANVRLSGSDFRFVFGLRSDWIRIKR